MKRKSKTRRRVTPAPSTAADVYRSQLAEIDSSLSLIDASHDDRISAIAHLIDRADGVDQEPYDHLPDLDVGVPRFVEDARSYGRRIGDEMRLMHGAWVAATDRAEAAAELVAELAMPDRALRRAVRMRGVAAMIYDRIDRKRSSRPGCVPKKKMDHADLERLCELNMREYNFGIPLSDGELQEQRRLRDMLAAHDGDR